MSQPMTRKSQGFLKGALILSLATIVVKIIGAIYKIPITGMLTGQGMGYYNCAYNIFNVIYTLSTAGLPVAVAKLVSENVAKGQLRNARKVFRVAATTFCVTGLTGFLVTFFGAKLFAGWMSNSNAYLAIAAIAPAILFGCFMSAYRGYYQGLNDMRPTAYSEMLESIIKLVCGLSFAYFVFQIADGQYHASGEVFGQMAKNAAEATKLAMPYAAAASILGVSLSTGVGFVFLLLRHKIKGDGFTSQELDASPAPVSGRKILKGLLAIAVPICVGSVMFNLTALIDTMSIMNRLVSVLEKAPQTLIDLCGQEVLKNKGIELTQNLSQLATATKEDIANYIYGSFGFSNSLFSLIPSITSTFGISVLPTITACWTLKDKQGVRSNINTLLRMCTLIAMPAGIGMSMLSNQVLQFLYGAKPEVDIAGPLLAITGIGAICLSVAQPIYSALQGLGRPDIPVVFMVLGGVLKVIINFVLVGIPAVNIYGAAIGTLTCYAFILVASLWALCKLTHTKVDWAGALIKPLISALLCGITAKLVYQLLSGFSTSRIMLLLGILAGGMIYLFMMCLLKGFKECDILLLPKGAAIARILDKMHCLAK